MDLRAIYESLSLHDVDGFVQRHQEENLHLEFKRVSNPDLVGDDKRHLARVLSSFANSAGGIIVWGVDARRNAEGTADAASALHEIEPLGILISRLNEYTGQATEPIVAGVLHRAIEMVPGRGYAVTLVPESNGGPHMAKLGEDRYYKRAGDRVYRMEHFDIADMFGRRARPKLELTIRPRSGGTELIFGLKNVGRGIARAPYLALSCPPPFRRSPYGIDGNRTEAIQKLVADNPHAPWRYPARADFVIHPGVTVEIGVLMRTGNDTPLAAEGVRLSYAIACEGMPLSEGEHLVPHAELR